MKKKMCWTVITVVLALTLMACVQTTAPGSPEPTAPLPLAGQPTATPCTISVAEEPPGWPESFEEATSQAELVVLADVVSLEQGPDVVQDPAYPDYRMPTQLTTTQVVKAYKGAVTPGQRLILYQSGIGIVTDLSSPLWSDDVRQCDKIHIIRGNEPYYQPGERYLLALTPVVLSEEEKGLQPEPLPEGMVRTLWRGRLLVSPDGVVESGETVAEIEAQIAAVLGGEYATPVPAPTPTAPYLTPTPASLPGDFQVTLTATPQKGTAPLSVRLTAILTGGPDNSYELNCAIMLWQTGDGVEIPWEMTCATWSPEISIGRHYTMEHTYIEAGTYQARVQMGDLVSNIVMIEVR